MLETRPQLSAAATAAAADAEAAGARIDAAALQLPRAPLVASAPVRRIVFGSCNNQRRQQPIWDAVVLPRRPDLFIWLGDIVYADKAIFLKLRLPGSPADVAAAYAKQLTAHAGYRRLVAAVPVVGVYDDHDMGHNDADRFTDEALRRASQRLLLDFLGVPADSGRRAIEGAYSGLDLGGTEGAGVVQLLLLDNRFHRDRYQTWLGPLALPLLASQKQQDVLGAEQWAWLEREVQRGSPSGEAPADVLLIGSGVQVVSANDPWVAESWSKLPQSRARLFALLALHNRSRAVFLSGDVHFGEISRTECAFVGYPLYDVTSSGLTHSWGGVIKRTVVGWSMLTSTRVIEAAVTPAARSWLGGRGWANERNVGELALDWSARTLTARVIGDDGRVQLELPVPFAALERGAMASDDPDIEACAHAPMAAGLTPACARLLDQCGPKPSSGDLAFYFLWHCVVGLAMSAVGLFVLCGPCSACLAGSRIQRIGGARGAIAIWACVVAMLWSYLQTFHYAPPRSRPLRHRAPRCYVPVR